MKNWILSRSLFWGATFAALLLYCLTVPDGLPWGVSMPRNPIWNHCVRTFAGHHIALACAVVSFAAGTVAALAFRFFDWRVAVGAALAWMFAPWVWNRAITGDWKGCLAAAGVFGAWLIMTAGHRVLRKARAAKRAEREVAGVLGEIALPTAGRIARTLLSNAKWQDFIPANAVMGSVAAAEEDYVSSEAFFQKATASTNNVPLVVWNDYADVLMHLGKPEKAEEMARRAVEGSGETFWVARLTLAQTLSAQKKNTRELRDLCRSVLRNASTNVHERVRTKVEKLKREAVR